MALMDEFKEERAQMKNQPFLKRLEYFWDYNKLPVLLGLFLVIMVSSILYNALTQKEVGLWVAMVDCIQDPTPAEEYRANLIEKLGIDTSEYDVRLDTSYQISATTDSGDSSLAEALSVRVATGEIDVFLADETFFSSYAVSDVFVDLRTVLTSEQLAKYADNFYYIDYARIEEEATDPIAKDLMYLSEMQPHNPETMEKPIPIGIYVTPTEEFKKSYYFSKKEDLVFGIVFNHGDINYITTFLDTMSGF